MKVEIKPLGLFPNAPGGDAFVPPDSGTTWWKQALKQLNFWKEDKKMKVKIKPLIQLKDPGKDAYIPANGN